MIVIGVDPGMSGAIAIVGNHRPAALKLPTNDRDIDIAAVRIWLQECVVIDDVALAVVEKVGAMPGQGVTSMFTFGHATGEVVGMLKTMGIPVQRVAPQRWKKYILDGTDKSKDAAVAYVRNRYPALSLLPTPRSRKPDDGMADAVCMAEYGLRFLLK